MTLGLFDVVGPVMHGPSSSHTAGANRIGFLAGKIIGAVPEAMSFGFHPIYYKAYAGQRSHAALAAGCLGYREDDPRSVNAWEEAKARGIAVACFDLGDDSVHRNTMQVQGKLADASWDIQGISVGGGNIVIRRINGVEVELDGNNWVMILVFADQARMLQAQQLIAQQSGNQLLGSYAGPMADYRKDKASWLFCGIFDRKPVIEPDDSLLLCQRVIEPLYQFRDHKQGSPLFMNFTELLQKSEQSSLLDVVLEYESQRSGQPKEAVQAEARRLVSICQEAMNKGFAVPIKLIGGLCTGDDGKKLLKYAQSGQTLMGTSFNMALARSVVLAEMNGAMGKVVAAPTGGAAGTLPGVLWTVAEILQRDEKAIADALLVAAAMGVIIGNRASFSGAVGGCQGEVGIGAAMAAGGAVWLAGGSAEAAIHAAALTIKNVLGLTCDPPASPVEVPCIKRNAMGAAVALMGAELALAGVRSVIPPDDVVEALADTQKRLPSELKGSCGGLAATKSGDGLRQVWADKLAGMQ